MAVGVTISKEVDVEPVMSTKRRPASGSRRRTKVTGDAAAATPARAEASRAPRLRGLRPTDQETARVVAIFEGRQILGAGCLISRTHVLTCAHVVSRLADQPHIDVELCGVRQRPRVRTVIERPANLKDNKSFDLALLRIVPGDAATLNVNDIEFATPLRHAGKRYSVLGFPAAVWC